MNDPVIAQKSPYPVKGKNTFGALAAKVADSHFATAPTREQTFYLRLTLPQRAEHCTFVDASTLRARHCVMARTMRCRLTLHR